MELVKKSSKAAEMRQNARKLARENHLDEQCLMVVAMSVVQMSDYLTELSNDQWFRSRISGGRRLEMRMAVDDARRQFGRMIETAGVKYEDFEAVIADGVDELERYAANLKNEIKRAQAAMVRFEAMEAFCRCVMMSVVSMQADAIARSIGMRMSKMDGWLSLFNSILGKLVNDMRLVEMGDGSTEAVRFYAKRFAEKQVEVATRILTSRVRIAAKR